MNKIDLIKALISDEKGEEMSETNSGGSKIKIAILQRGWVFIGKFSKEGMACKLTDAYNIRTWGTTKGLGELAENGPIKNKTILDKTNDVMFHELGIVALIDCSDEVWSKEL